MACWGYSGAENLNRLGCRWRWPSVQQNSSQPNVNISRDASLMGQKNNVRSAWVEKEAAREPQSSSSPTTFPVV